MPKRGIKPGQLVILWKLPAGLLRGLPRSDQKVIRRIVGKPVLLEGYEEDGRAELSFTDAEGVHHLIFVKRSFIKDAKSGEVNG